MANPLYGQNKADGAIQDGKSSVIVAGDDITLTAAQTGSTVFMNAAAKTIQLPAAAPGLNYKVIFGIDTTAGADILAASGDAFYGKIVVNDNADDKIAVQALTFATVTNSTDEASYDVMTFDGDSNTSGCTAGDVVELIACDDNAWFVHGSLMTTGTPSSVAVIGAS